MNEDNRFRATYRFLSDEEKETLESIKSKAEELGGLMERIGHARYRDNALTALEESVMWAVKGITS